MLILKVFVQVSINIGTCIVQSLIYMHLLTIRCLHNKAAVVTKNVRNFDSLTTNHMGLSNSRYIDNYADYASGIHCMM